MKYQFLVEDGPAAYKHGRKDITFMPEGRHKLHGRNPTDVLWDGKPANSARMFIGFNVGQTPKWNVDYLAQLVRRVRSEQTNDEGKKIPPDASFVIQKGMYTNKGQPTVYENSVQLIVLSLFGESDKKFKDNMLEMAGIIARELEQREVILELQTEGVPKWAAGIGWTSVGEAAP